MCPRSDAPAVPPPYCDERRRRPVMTDPQQPDFWQMMFQQTPAALRWLFGVVTLGLFTLAGMLWARQERRMEQINTELHARMDREMTQIHKRLDKQTDLLVQIANNTGHNHG